MKMPGEDGRAGGPAGMAEETLRLVAALQAPEGLEQRVRARLATAPRRAGLLEKIFSPLAGAGFHGPAFRTAAAAAIVCVVAGGGWQVLSHVQSPGGGSAVVQPARIGDSGSFGNAGAMRTPDTLRGPVLAHVYDVAGARENAARLGSSPVAVRGHFWLGKEGSMIFDSGSKAILTLRFSDVFNTKHSYRELVGKTRKSDIATITGHLHSEANGRLVLTVDEIQFADDSQ